MNVTLRRNLVFIMLAFFLIANSAWASVEYTSLLSDRIELDSRSGPAKASNESEDSLSRNGYARIGSVQSVLTLETCYGDDCTILVPPANADATSEILMEAAVHGGDLVTFSMKNYFHSQRSGTSKKGRCLERGFKIEYVPEYDLSGKQIGTRSVNTEGCVEFEKIHETKFLVTSVGVVWRYDPEFATGNAFVSGAAEGDLDRVREILSKTKDTNLRNIEGMTALYAAVKEGRTAIVRLLLDHGADANGESLGPEPLLSIAQRKWYADIAEILIGAGATPLTQSQSDYVIAHKASTFFDTRPGNFDFGFTTLDGREIIYSTNLKGKKFVYLYFWATWNLQSREQLVGLSDIERRFGDTMQVIAINVGEERSKVLQLIDQLDQTPTISLVEDGIIAENFKFHALPAAFILDKSGVVCMEDNPAYKRWKIDSVPPACTP